MSQPAFALWRLGFRPFYLLAAGFSALSVALWAAQYAGLLRHAYLGGPTWHAHEMLFGYTLAVVTGFLFTAVRNWTGKSTPTGAPLAGLAALWLAGRVLVLTPWSIAAAVVNVAFPLGVAAGIGRAAVARTQSTQLLLCRPAAAAGAALACIHLAALGVLAVPPWVGLQLGLDVILFVMSVMAGRVVPMFTNNAVPGARARRSQYVEHAALGGVLALLLADLLRLPGPLLLALTLALAVVHARRLWLWDPRSTLRTPLLWVLHLAYAWIPLHLALRAAAEAGWVMRPLAVHALSMGAIGGLTIGMMVRTARGHTGRRAACRSHRDDLLRAGGHRGRGAGVLSTARTTALLRVRRVVRGSVVGGLPDLCRTLLAHPHAPARRRRSGLRRCRPNRFEFLC